MRAQEEKFQQEVKEALTKRIESCYGNFCNMTTGEVDRTKAVECIIDNCVLGVSCFAMAQSLMMYKLYKKLGERTNKGDEWKGEE